MLLSVTVRDASSQFGGTLSFMSNNARVGISNFFIENSHAQVAGGAIFFHRMCSLSFYSSIFCNSSSTTIRNSSAETYGDKCATPASSLNWRDMPLPAFVAPHEPISVALVFHDYFETVLPHAQVFVTVALRDGETGAVSLSSGVPRDRVFADQRGEFSFSSLQLSGNTSGATGELFFIADESAPKLCENQVPSIAANFTLLNCLPSKYPSMPTAGQSQPLECHECPIGSYLLSQAADELGCLPCLPNADGGEEEAVDCFRRRDVVSGHNESKSGRWEIRPGFYPSPSFVAPQRLLKCPNEACKGSSCDVRLQLRSPFFFANLRCSCSLMRTTSGQSTAHNSTSVKKGTTSGCAPGASAIPKNVSSRLGTTRHATASSADRLRPLSSW